MTTQAENTNVLFASANFGIAPPAFRSLEFLGHFVRNADYDGVEMHPIIHGPSVVARAALDGQIDLFSLHQSFRAVGEERDTNQPLSKQSLTDAVFSSILGSLIMPSMEKSAIGMNTVQSTIGHRLPGIFYPQSDPARDIRYLGLAKTSLRLYQPTDHVAQLMGAETVIQMLAVSQERGYDGLCLDTFHVQRFYGKGEPGVVSNLDAALEELARSTKAVHLSLNRYDFASTEPHINSRGDAMNLLQGTLSGAMKDILDAVIELGDARNFTIELTLQGMKDVTGYKKNKDLLAGYRQIGDTLRDYICSKHSKK